MPRLVCDFISESCYSFLLIFKYTQALSIRPTFRQAIKLCVGHIGVAEIKTVNRVGLAILISDGPNSFREYWLNMFEHKLDSNCLHAFL